MNADTPEALHEYPIILTLPILWGNQDAFGHVNNVVYFRWFESARVAYLNDTGLQSLMSQANLGPILASIKCDFRRQLNFPDTVRVGARITRIGNKSVSMEHAIYSDALQAIAATADSVVVLFDYARQGSCMVPVEVRAKISAIEGKAFTST
jgi:acyl-CoA thioester hydrolase